MSLAQGVVHWKPPSEALQAVQAACLEPDSHSYCADDGLPSLREALKAKVAAENGLANSEVMVTSGSNQAYTNVAISLLDAQDSAILFAPFYFNHAMALQMTGCEVVHGKVLDDLTPDITWLEQRLKDKSLPPIKMVTLVNPGNPTGVMIPQALLQKASELCKEAGAWLVCDNAYEYFAYEDEGAPPHSCVEGDHVINTFSFSKAYGMMGWRVGYLAYPPAIRGQLLKAQDTIPICPPVLSQKLALAVLKGGRKWVQEQVSTLKPNKELMLNTLRSTLGEGSVRGGTGAIYLMAKLPNSCPDDTAVVEWLCAQHKVAVIPGSACGYEGFIRVCYSNLQEDKCKDACARLGAGLSRIVSGEVSFPKKS